MSFTSNQLDLFDPGAPPSLGAAGLWIGPPVRAALDEVMLAIKQSASVIVVGGGAGYGKTVLAELIVRRCAEIGRPARPIVRGDFVQSHIPQECNVIVVDEADSIAELELRAILPTADCEQSKRCYVFLCLPTSMRRFRSANAVGIELRALSRSEALEYMMEFSGRNGRAELFTTEALDTIVVKTRGVPRLLDRAASFAQFLAASEGEARVGLKHVMTALKSQMVDLHGFGALPAEESATPLDSVSIQTTDTDAAEIQAIRDGSIGDRGRTKWLEDDTASLACPITVISPISPVIRRRELAAVCIAALIVSVVSVIAVSGFRTWAADNRAVEYTLSLAPILPAVLEAEHAPLAATQASLVAPDNRGPPTPFVAPMADFGGTASRPPGPDAAHPASDPPPSELSPKERVPAATKVANGKSKQTAPARRFAQDRAIKMREKPNQSTGARRNIAQESAEAARLAGERAAHAAEEARVGNEQARRAQEAAYLAVVGADEAAERVRELDPAIRIGRRLRTFFIRPFDSMKSITRARLEPEKSVALQQREGRIAPSRAMKQ